MTVNVSELKAVLRSLADAAAQESKRNRSEGRFEDAEFHAGRQAGLVTALGQLRDAETRAALERDAVLGDLRCAVCGRVHDRAVRCEEVRDRQGARVNLGAVERLEDFARSAGGAVDMASGTVYSDADPGL